MRYSKQRECIYEVVASTKCHPDADWVYDKVKAIMPDVSLGTVYRNLKSLANCGRLDSLETTHDSLHFDADVSLHAHFVCEGCGKIYDMPISSSDVEVPEGFEIKKQKHIYYGICHDCGQKIN